jgi:hypothetical protein
MLAALGEVCVGVEAGSAGGEQDDVAGLGRLGGGENGRFQPLTRVTPWVKASLV